MAKSIDWGKVKEWDEKYYIHPEAAKSEYQFVPIESTEGDYLILPDGTRLLDFFNQLYCVNAGQRNEKVQAAIREATERYGFVWEAFTTDYRAKAAKLIVEDILGPYNWAGKVSFTTTGSEAVEKALIIAKLFKNRPNIITREHAYHGWTMGAAGCTRLIGVRGALAATDSPEYRQVPAHPVAGYYTAPAPNCFNCSLGHTYPGCKMSDGKLPCVLMTENLIKNIGPDTVAAMITEPAFGAGSFIPPKEYLPQIRKMTKELDIVWICDEVLAGFGRMGYWFAHQQYDVQPDIMTIAKGFVSSALPASGVVVNKEIADFMDKWRWCSVGTFSAHPVAMAAVCANLEYMLEVDLPGMCKKAGDYFGARLRELEEKHPCVGEVSGAGMLWVVEIVKNKKTKERFAPECRNTLMAGDLSMYPSKFIMAKTLEKGVMLGGFTPNTLNISGSCNVSKEDMDKAIDALDYALSAMDEYCTA
jgi:taurine--2-oxoglutarate transaminase